jgi:hypothetical protein
MGSVNTQCVLKILETRGAPSSVRRAVSFTVIHKDTKVTRPSARHCEDAETKSSKEIILRVVIRRKKFLERRFMKEWEHRIHSCEIEVDEMLS